MKNINAIALLSAFVNQRSGIEFANYGDVSAFRKEQREIGNDKKDYFELLSLASNRVENLNDKILAYLKASSGRLTLNEKGELNYCTGQYFPIEYRPAACQVIKSIIWNSYANEKNADGTDVYSDGHAIRKAIRRNLSRRVSRNYFN